MVGALLVPLFKVFPERVDATNLFPHGRGNVMAEPVAAGES